MSFRPYRLGRSLEYSFFLWVVGFVWGVVVFAVPALKNVPSVPYVSKFPAISAPLVVLYIVMLYPLARTYLRGTDRRAQEAMSLGLTILVLNFALDLLVYVLLLGSPDYFAYLSIWFSYAMFIVIPWLVGRTPEEHPLVRARDSAEAATESFQRRRLFFPF